jgi:creatinine amidohydrolase
LTSPDLETVCWADLYPDEFERRLRDCPIAYIPFGSLEWHSHHMPYGVDTYKAQAIVERVARRYGGIVVPGIPWGSMHGSWRAGTHPGLSKETRDAFYADVFRGLVEVGFKVLVGVSGHWTSKQTGSVRVALEAVRDSGVTGLATFDGSDPYDGFPPDPDLGMDHAGARETSIFMYLFPDRVKLERLRGIDLSDLPGEECHLTCSGIQGESPLHGASEELGRRHVEKLVPLIGEAALELLRSSAAGR